MNVLLFFFRHAAHSDIVRLFTRSEIDEMSRMAVRVFAFATIALSPIAGAVLNGPVNTPCSGTTTAGTVVNGTQGWSINPATGAGYWSCCAPGTSCVGRDKPQKLSIRNGDRLEPAGAASSAPPRALQPKVEPAPALSEHQQVGSRGRGD